MTEQQIINQISRCFPRLRRHANLTQTSLAKIMGIDQAKLSRMEKGEIYSPFDTEKYLNALATSDAAKFKDFLNSEWEFIEIPDFWNPQYDSLLYAEEVIQKVSKFLDTYKSISPLQTYLQKGKDQILSLSKYLWSRTHNIAFLGSIGIGKSTAISYLFNLLFSKSNTEKGQLNPILETGAGGTTICEVQIVDADEYGISIVPYSNEEFNNILSDFCKIFWVKFNSNKCSGKYEDISQSKELMRAIRNMSKLTIKKVGNEKNKQRVDPIEKIALTSSSEDEFKVKILNMINLPNRSNTAIMFDKDPSKDASMWIAEKFTEVNNGRIENMPLPKKMTLMIPKLNSFFNNALQPDYNLSVIDTKGIDDIIVRADIDDQIKNDRTVVIFCARFNDASGKPTKEIIDHIKNDLGISVENGKFALMVLPRDDEALQVKDDDGYMVNDVEEGYEIKEEQIKESITDNFPIYFYNYKNDSPHQTQNDIKIQINNLREYYADRINELALTMDYAMANSEEVAYLQALEEITNRITFFLKGNNKLTQRKREIFNYVSRIFYSAHPSTLWASTRRHGVYGNLNICYVISNSATSDANERFNGWLNSFKGLINSLKADESLSNAEKYINDIENFSSELKNKFLEAVSNCGAEVFCEKITTSSMWYDCSSEWGRGPGFKNRVLNHIEDWFKNNQDLQNQLDDLIDKFWDELVISAINKMISSHLHTST